MGGAQIALVTTHLLLFIHAGQSIRCYGCTGFDINRPLHRITNNPACADGNFDWRQVQIYTAYTPGFSCYSFTYNNGQNEITQRFMVRSPLLRLDDETLSPRNRAKLKEREYREREYRDREYRDREGLGIEGTIVKGFYCHRDYCNGTMAVVSSLGLLILLNVVVMLLRWWY